MRKLIILLAFIPIITFGQGTQNLTVKRIKTDSLYIQKLASVSSSNIVLVLDSATGKIGKRPYPAGGGDSYWQELTGNLANIDTTTGFYVNSTSGVKNTNLSMYPASSWWRIEQSNRTTGVQSVAQGSAGVVSLQANAGGATDVVQVNGAGYLYGRTGSNGMNLGSSTYRWGLLYSDSINTKSVYSTGSVNGRSQYGIAVWGNVTESGTAVYGNASGTGGCGVDGRSATGGIGVRGVSSTGDAGNFQASGAGRALYAWSNTGYSAIFAKGNVGIGKTNPSTALDVAGVITATGGTSTDWNNAAGWVTTNGGNVANWNTAYGWGNHADGGYLQIPEGGLNIGDMFYYSNAGKIDAITAPSGEDVHGLEWSAGAPTWQPSQWLRSGNYTYRMNRVGIGIENPTRWLDVAGAVRSDTTLTPLVLGGSAVSSSLTLKSTSWAGSSDYINFVTGNGTERMRILSDGKVGIGTTNPSTILDIRSGGTIYLQVSSAYTRSFNSFLNAATGSYSWADRGGVGISSPGNNLIAINNATGVGIGTTAPSAKLHVNGGIMLDGTDTTGVGSSAKVGTIQYFNGNFYGLKAGTPPTWVQLNN